MLSAMPKPSPRFHGVWQLDPSTLDYQFGRPGRRAIYTIRPLPEGLEFTLDADDADGVPMHHVYGGALDGVDYPIAGRPMTLSMDCLDERTVESVLRKDGVVLDRWTRTLEPDGNTMVIRQHGIKPDGQIFTNSGVYRRVSEK